MHFFKAFFQIMENTFLHHLSLSCFCLLSLLTTLQTDSEERRD